MSPPDDHLRTHRRTAADDRRLHAGGARAPDLTRSSSASPPPSTSQGAGEEGLGEDVTYSPEDQRAQQARGPDLPLAGTWTFASFCEHVGGLDLFPAASRGCRPSVTTAAGRSRAPRSTSPCARPASRSRRRSAARSRRSTSSRRCGSAAPRASTRRPAARGVPVAAVQARRHAGLGPGADRPARGDRRGRVDRLQGRLQGHARRRRHGPGVLPAHRRDAPERVARGPGPDRSRGRRRARALPPPHHLGRAHPLRSPTSRTSRSRRARSTSSRRASARPRSCSRPTTTAPSAGSRSTAAASPSSASGAGRSSTSPRCSIPTASTTSRRRATTGPSSREGLPASPLAPDHEPTGFRRRT